MSRDNVLICCGWACGLSGAFLADGLWLMSVVLGILGFYFLWLADRKEEQ